VVDPSERVCRENYFVAESEAGDETCLAVLGVLPVLAHSDLERLSP